MPPAKKLILGKGHKSLKANASASSNEVIDTVDGKNEGNNDENDVIIDEMMSDEDRATLHAKLELMKASDENGVSLYQHLAELLTKVLSNKPEKAADMLEKISGRMKIERLPSCLDVKVVPEEAERNQAIDAEWKLYKTIGTEPVDCTRTDKQHIHSTTTNNDYQKLTLLPDLMRQCHMFNMAGFGLPMSEYTRLSVAMRELVFEWPLKSIRFWGKILGTHKNYYVVETEFLEGENEIIDDDDDEGKDNESEHSGESDNLSKDISIFDDSEIEIPVPYKPLVKIPCEDPGFGANLKTYFVCNEPGLPWFRLPHVTPDQICKARLIRTLFTGDLNHVHATFPPFPGSEANYLRAQIARITSSTSISPIGYFKFDEDGEEEEEHAEPREACILDEDFDGLSARELSDTSLQGWVHHSSYILPQGRTNWYNPLSAKNEVEEGEGEDEEEDREEPDEPEPELPLPLLVPISEDGDVGPSPPWVARITSQFVPEHSPVAVVSVRWPGAVTVAIDKGRFFENIYIGFGQKDLGDTFEPTLPKETFEEFPTGPEVMEEEDPTPEEEAAVKAALREQEELSGGRDDDDDDDEEEEEGNEGDEDENY